MGEEKIIQKWWKDLKRKRFKERFCNRDCTHMSCALAANA